MKILAATTNQGKLAEIDAILAPRGFTVVSPAEAGCSIEVEEDGETFKDNALKKARAWMSATGITVLADDSGLCVDALDGRPGVRSARFAGEDATDADNCALLLKSMVGKQDRCARFVCVVALVFPDGREFTAEGECPGEILDAPRGSGGFGYDPLFLDPLSGLSFAELSSVQKNLRSHRLRALQGLGRQLEEQDLR